MKIKTSKYLSYNGYSIDYDFYFKSDFVGECEVVTKFIDKEFDYFNNAKKSDFQKHHYFIEIWGFEIDESHRGKGFGIFLY